MKEEKEKDWRKERGKREDETIAHEPVIAVSYSIQGLV